MRLNASEILSVWRKMAKFHTISDRRNLLASLMIRDVAKEWRVDE